MTPEWQLGSSGPTSVGQLPHLSPHLRACSFFFNDTATTEIYTLSLHDALPISAGRRTARSTSRTWPRCSSAATDRKSTRLNSSHGYTPYAVFCLKKKHTHP